MLSIGRRFIGRRFTRVAVAFSLAVFVSACANTPFGSRASTEQIAEIEQALDLLYYQRAEFDPGRCQSASDGAFFAMLGGELYSVPLDSFVAGRVDDTTVERPRQSAGCPENPFRASSLTFAAEDLKLDSQAPPLSAARVQITVVTDARRDTLERRAERVFALAETGKCTDVENEPDFLSCATTEQIFSDVEATTYFVAATAEAPALDGSPFASRCIERDMARPCSIVDRLDAHALIAIDYDPDAAALSQLITLHDHARKLVLSLRRGVQT